jgi:hypothetical protein
VGWWLYDKSLGDLVYAIAAYLTLALFLRRSARFIAPLALTLCLAVEFFQATGIPAQYAHLLVRWLIGTTFSWHDIASYFVGVTVGAVLDIWLLRPGRGPRPA